MGRHRFSSPLALAILGGLSLFVAGTVAGCGPACKPGDERAECAVECDPLEEHSNCNQCSDMPAPQKPTAFAPVACARRIAVDPSGKCLPYNDAGSATIAWDGQPLFKGAGGTLGQYCQYDWQIPGKEPNGSLLPLANSEDCTYIAPQGPDSLDQWARKQAVDFVNNTASGSRPLAGAMSPATGGLHTRVVVLDTSPDNDVQRLIEPGDSSRHGETLAYLIRDIACSNAVNCSVEVKTQLVMPWLMQQGTTTPELGGGNAGQLSDVSLGLWNEVTQFTNGVNGAAASSGSASALTVPTRLVFNESFGWGDDGSGAICSSDPSQSPRWNVRALYDMFQAAACVGAMHVAAAGNHTGGQTPSQGLLCPARWDHKVRPSQKTCEALFGKATFDQLQGDFQSVTSKKYATAQDMFDPKAKSVDALVSVGGVDFGGEPIVLTRPEACPEVVALGVGGVSWDVTSSSPSVPPVLFGTSMSAAVVSARLAAEWSQPGQSGQLGWAAVGPAMLSQLVTKESKPRPFISGGACTHLQATTCNDVAWIGAPATATTLQNPPLGKAAKVLGSSQPKVRTTITQDTAPVCSGLIPQCVSENPSAAPSLVWGQPTDPLCLRCGVTIGSAPVLWVYPSGSFLDGTGVTCPPPPSSNCAAPGMTCLRSAALVIESSTGAPILTQGLPVSAVVSTSQVTVNGLPAGSLGDARAWLSAYDVCGHSVSQQIYISP